MTPEFDRSDQDRLTLPIVTASLVGIALVLAREATYGVAWFGDGIYYVSAARSVLAGDGLLTFDREPLTTWPPGFSLALALLSGFGSIDPATVVGPLNVAAHGLTIFVVGNYLRQRLESRPLVVWACLAVALSTPLVDVGSRMLTAPLFILLTIVALIHTHRLLTHGDKSALFLAATFSALAWQTRYLGIVLPVVIGLFLLAQSGASWQLRARRLIIYSAIVALPMCLWTFRNYILVGAVLGPRGWGNDPSLFWRKAKDAVLEWLDFDLPLVPGSDWLTPTLNIIGPLALLACAGMLVVATRPRVRSSFDWRPCWLFGGFSLAYFAALNIASSMEGASGGFQTRYIAPLCVPTLMAATFAFDWLFGRASANKRTPSVGDGRQHSKGRQALPKVLVGTLGTVLALWVADQTMHNVREVRRENSFAENTRDLSAPRWLGSETLRYIRENPLRGVVFSNQQEMVYFNNAGKAEYWWLRSHGHYRDLSFAHEKTMIRVRASERPSSAEDGTYLVWFRNWDSYIFPFGETQMSITPDLLPVASLADGAIFKVEQGHVPSNPYRHAHRLILAGDLGSPAVRSIFDVYRVGRTLTYVKQPCLPDDTHDRFFLDFTVAPSGAGNEGYMVAEQFDFWEAGTMLDGDLCIAIAKLPPSLPIAHMRTGQLGSNGWSAEPQVAGLGAHGT